MIGAVFVYRAVRKELLIQQQQQHFMMAVTHELKTPIAVTRLNLETLQKYQLAPEKQQKLIRISLDETARLNFLTNNILVSSQLDSNGFSTDKEELDLSALMRDCITDLKKRFPERILQSSIEEDIDLKGDPLLLQILINNLLENAVKYSPTETPLAASLQRKEGHILLEVADQGPGIPDSEKKKIFDRFYRIGNESTRTTKGTGLGLYLCKRIAKDHQAVIEVKDNQPRGTVFTIIFAA
jgi:signal transduction histidine kinase